MSALCLAIPLGLSSCGRGEYAYRYNHWSDLERALADIAEDPWMLRSKKAKDALHGYVESGNMPVVRFFMRHGVSLPDRNHRGETTLMAAVRSGKPDMIRLVLDAGADVNSRQRQCGLTCLDYAALWGKTEIVRLLVASGADINRPGRFRKWEGCSILRYPGTPLHLVAQA
ncbi:MAG: ankyrin repeat domain-containing protein, partial [Planctomycetota bacterium]